jgi:predicted transcriptional regulator
MEFSEDIKHALGSINYLERKKKLPTMEAIRTCDYMTKWNKDDQALINLLDQLFEKEWISRADNAYSLTRQGLALAKQVESQWFGDWIVASEQSKTYRKS